MTFPTISADMVKAVVLAVAFPTIILSPEYTHKNYR
jgi:hypothetical protein